MEHREKGKSDWKLLKINLDGESWKHNGMKTKRNSEVRVHICYLKLNMLQKVTACESHMQTNTKIDVGLMDQKRDQRLFFEHQESQEVWACEATESYQKLPKGLSSYS